MYLAILAVFPNLNDVAHGEVFDQICVNLLRH